MEFALFRGLILPWLSVEAQGLCEEIVVKNDIAWSGKNFRTVLRNTDPQDPLLDGINDTEGMVNQHLYSIFTNHRGSGVALLPNGPQVRIDLKRSCQPCIKVIINCWK